jgi:hypothetical protein
MFDFFYSQVLFTHKHIRTLLLLHNQTVAMAAHSGSPIHHFNILLIAIILLAFMTFFLSSGGSVGSLAEGSPISSSLSSQHQHPIRHRRHRHRVMHFVVPRIECPINMVRGHDGGCYRQWHRSRRSIALVPEIDPCQRLHGYTLNHEGGCSRIGPTTLNSSSRNKRRAKTATFSVRKADDDAKKGAEDGDFDMKVKK